MCKQLILINRNGRWYNKATGKQYVGKAFVRGQWYEYTKDGRKFPLRKPKPDLNVLIDNLWMTLDSGRHRRRLRDYFYYGLGGKTRFHLDTAPTPPPNILLPPFSASMLIP